MAKAIAPRQSDQASGREDPAGVSLLGAPETDLIPEALRVPGMSYQWVTMGELHEYLRPKTYRVKGEIKTRPPWEVVKDDIPAEMRPRSMDAQGSPMGGAFTHGQMVAICIPEKYVAEMRASNDELVSAKEKALDRGAEDRGADARIRHATAKETDGDFVPPFVRAIETGSRAAVPQE